MVLLVRVAFTPNVAVRKCSIPSMRPASVVSRHRNSNHLVVSECEGPAIRTTRRIGVALIASAALTLPCIGRPAPSNHATPSAMASEVLSSSASTQGTSRRSKVSSDRLAAAQVVVLPKSTSASRQARFSLRDRAEFLLGEFFMWNSLSRLMFLFFLAIGTIYAGSVAFRLLDPDGSETNRSPVWMSVRSYLNPMEDDYAKVYLRILSVTMAMLGTVFFGIFIGMVTEAVESGIARADDPSSRVVASNHIVICGWNANTAKVISDINAVGGGNKIVVLVAAHEKESMVEELRDALSEEQLKRTSVSVRAGSPVLQSDLDRVGASHAQKIILSAGRGLSAAESDRRIISRALALRANAQNFSGDIVAELSSARDEQILQSILRDTNARSVQAVSAERLLFRFMAQAVRQVGLADCVAELMGENPSTVFHVAPVDAVASGLVGMRYGDILPTTIPDCIICGYFDKTSGKLVVDTLGSKKSPMLTRESELLLLGRPSGGRSSVRPHSPKDTSELKGSHRASRLLPVKSKRVSENILVCGWRANTMNDFLSELDSILGRGSAVTIIDVDAPEHAELEADLKLKNISISSVRKQPSQFKNLQAILSAKNKAFDRVLILSSALGMDNDDGKIYRGVEEDSKALTSLCYVNDLLKSRPDGGKSTTVTIEFGNEQVAEIARRQSTGSNVILPNSLSAHIASQTVRDFRLNSLWDELLSQAGREVYLRPVSSYLRDISSRASFSSLCDDAAAERSELIIGYMTGDGVPVLNPAGALRFETRTWSAEDQLVVIAEDP